MISYFESKDPESYIKDFPSVINALEIFKFLFIFIVFKCVLVVHIVLPIDRNVMLSLRVNIKKTEKRIPGYLAHNELWKQFMHVLSLLSWGSNMHRKKHDKYSILSVLFYLLNWPMPSLSCTYENWFWQT